MKRGDRRDDGYIYYGEKNHPNGKTYQIWMSPMAHERQIERNKKWRTENHDQALKATREWKLNNPLRVRDYRKKWAAENADRIKKYQQKYKALKNNLNKEPVNKSNTR